MICDSIRESDAREGRTWVQRTHKCYVFSSLLLGENLEVPKHKVELCARHKLGAVVGDGVSITILTLL